MAETITGGYYLELDQKTGKPAKAHNANSEEVDLLSDAQVEQHKADGTPAPLKASASADAQAMGAQRAAAGSSAAVATAKPKRAKKPKK